MSMRYASVCDGIGAVHRAWMPEPLGWSCAWTSEIDPYPAAVVEHHFGLPNLGDMTAIDGEEAAREHGPIDLLVGGTPCQSFSVAGLRKGLDDERGNLAIVYLRLAAELRPRWVVWENVPGVLSSNGGRDFGAFLGGLVELGYGFAYRVLDAQYVRVDTHPRAVPQRRRRVFVVGYLGDPRPAAAVFLERESLRGDPAPRRTAGQEAAGGSRAGAAGAGGGVSFQPGQAPIVETVHGDIAHMLSAEGADASEDGTGRGTPIVVQPESGQGADLVAREADVAPSCSATDGKMHDRGVRVVEQTRRPISFAQNQRDEVRIVGGDGQRVDALAANAGMKQTNFIQESTLRVRRLTPRECERLQGFPDDHTLIEFGGKPASDSRRYRALGNSMPCNVMRWIGLRIDAVDRIVGGAA